MTAKRAPWTELAPEHCQWLTESGCTLELPRPQWPAWAQQRSQVQRVFIYGLQAGEVRPSVKPDGAVVARLLTERLDPRDRAPYNYNYYAVVVSSDGRILQSGPSSQIDFGHHLQAPAPDAILKVRRS